MCCQDTRYSPRILLLDGQQTLGGTTSSTKNANRRVGFRSRIWGLGSAVSMDLAETLHGSECWLLPLSVSLVIPLFVEKELDSRHQDQHSVAS